MNKLKLDYKSLSLSLMSMRENEMQKKTKAKARGAYQLANNECKTKFELKVDLIEVVC